MKTQMMNILSRFRRDEDGATLVEYGVALTLAVIVGAGAFTALGDNTAGAMTAASAQLPTAEDGGTAGGS